MKIKKTKKLAFKHINTVRWVVNINSDRCGAEQVRAALENAAIANLPTDGDVYKICDQDNARIKLACSRLRRWQYDGEKLRRRGQRGHINSSGFCVPII